MGQNYCLAPDQTRIHLLEASRGRLPVTLTYQATTGWVVLKARFIAGHDESDLLAMEFLNAAGEAGQPLPQTGQELGVSYRRGSRKCVFTACLVDATTKSTPSGGTRTVLRLSWPDRVEELQRRLYHRTPVPVGRLIPVDLWLAQGSKDPGNAPHRGQMVDLSAGGLSVELPRETHPRWREDEQLSCRFSAGSDRQPIEVTARLTNYTRLSDGHVRIGLQFLGLDTGDRGRHTLQKISRLTTSLRG